MPTIPPFMLKQLYVKGSLHNTESGFAFTLRNHLAPASLVGLGLAVDDAPVPGGALTVVMNDARTPAVAITAATPALFPTNTPTHVEVTGAPLPPGPHKIALLATTREIGPVTIEVSDTVA